MSKIKLFLEFVSGNKKSIFLPLSYDEISKKLRCSVDEVEKFENWLKIEIQPGYSFHGSFDTHQGEGEITVDVPMFDRIENEQQYLEMWSHFRGGDSSISHDYDGL